MRQIEQRDIDGARQMIRAKYRPYDSRAVGEDDYVAAGLLGLVRAAHEYDEARGGWVTLWRWRAEDQARSLLQWSVRMDGCTSVSFDDDSETPNERVQSALAVAVPQSEHEHCEAVLAAIKYVTGKIRRQVANAVWVDHESVSSIARRYGVHDDTIYTHLTHARRQVAEALAAGWIDPSLRGVGVELAAKYKPNGCAFSAKRRRSRNRQHGRADGCRNSQRQRAVAGGDHSGAERVA